MKTAKVYVLPYDEQWKTAFEEIRKELESVIGDLVIGIEHVRSTSVQGLSAKPCIDIDVIIRDFLRSNAEAAKKYGAVKETAARLFPDDVDKYIEYKTPCIEELYKMCGLK